MGIQIALFKNDRKEKDTHPDYTGWNKETGDSVSGWVKTATNGSKYISLNFETREEKEQRIAELRGQTQFTVKSKPSMESQAPTEPFNDDIPF